MMIKKHVSCTDLFCKENLYDFNSPEKGTFITSDYHFDFALSETSLQYIKTLIKNKPIFNNEFLFIIKHTGVFINKNHFLELRRLIDTSKVSRWIITMENKTNLERSIQSRALTVNCCFPLDNVIKCCNLPLDNADYQDVFIKSKGNVITFLQLTTSSHSSMLWQDTFDKCMTTIEQEKKAINVIALSREMAYKLFHIGVPFTDFCRYIAFKYQNRMSDLISFIADCEHRATKSNECLMYERVILHLYKHIKSSSKRSHKLKKVIK